MSKMQEGHSRWEQLKAGHVGMEAVSQMQRGCLRWCATAREAGLLEVQTETRSRVQKPVSGWWKWLYQWVS